jgi:hypothetical protein
MDTARNLLYGVLAWRTGLVDADQFASGCQSWAEHREQPLADLFAERGWLSAADRAALDVLLERNLRRHGGDALAALKAVGDAATWRAVAATNDAGLRQWLDGVLPGAAWLEEDEHKPKRGLAGATVALVVVCVLVGVVILAGLTGTTLLMLKQRQHQAVAEAQAMRALAEAEAASQQARREFGEATEQAVLDMFDETAPRPDLDAEQQRQRLEWMVTQCETRLKESGAGPGDRHKAARAYRRLGDVRRQLGDRAGARTAYERARELLQQATKEIPGSAAYRKELGEVEAKLKEDGAAEKGKP